MNPIWLRNETGSYAIIPMLPNCWQGETNCVVGPFSDKKVAESFALLKADFGEYDLLIESIFAKQDAWFVEIKRGFPQFRVSSPSRRLSSNS